MATVEVSCPNCGASGGVPAPHETRICSFCGTHYLLRPVTAPAPEVDPERPSGQAVDVSAIIIAIVVMLVLLAVAAIIIVAINSDEAPSNNLPRSYYAPGR
jgi:hypothetical protein